jgi:hypothetical protein
MKFSFVLLSWVVLSSLARQNPYRFEDRAGPRGLHSKGSEHVVYSNSIVPATDKTGHPGFGRFWPV